ncbi:MAG TPA: M48 family metalloprotease [Nevskiales bacterium]|nr:M48 family metalloprotease [Nevskiales bacterium]
MARRTAQIRSVHVLRPVEWHGRRAGLCPGRRAARHPWQHLKFSRDAEREADEIGFDLATAAGYDAREAAKLWQALLRERDQEELYRLRGKPGDDEQAKAAYRKALPYADVSAEAYRALGLLALKSGERQEARRLLGRYLELEPDAEDRAMVRSYLERSP